MTITITRHTQIDPYPDLSWLGEFSTRPKSDESIPVPAEWIGHRKWRNQGDLWYTPMNSIAESRAWHTARGYSKHAAYTLARAQALSDMKRLLAYYRGDWSMLALGVVVTYNGADIGEAWVGSVVSDNPDESMFDDLTDEAISCAESWLADSGARVVIDWAGAKTEKVSDL